MFYLTHTGMLIIFTIQVNVLCTFRDNVLFNAHWLVDYLYHTSLMFYALLETH